MSNNITNENCLAPGTVLIGGIYQYRIIRVIGNGTFGITYLTEIFDSNGYNTHQLAAVKELFMRDCNSRAADGKTVLISGYGDIFRNYFRRFRREAEAIRSIQQENELNVVSVIDCFEQNDTVYYSMTYIDGGSLNDRIEREGYLSENDALRIASITAKTLSVLHTRDMLHLDIKPANIMLLGGETPMLIDFGLAKHFGSDGAPEGTAIIGSGTPGYAPLEQSSYRPENSVPYTIDVYSLGATLFKMVTGKRPPDASDIFNDHFPAEELEAKGVSDATIRIIRRAMMPGSSSRYPNMAIFAADMDYVLDCIADGTEAGILPSEIGTQQLNGFAGDPYSNPFGCVPESYGFNDTGFISDPAYSPQAETGFETVDGVKRTPGGSIIPETNDLYPQDSSVSQQLVNGQPDFVPGYEEQLKNERRTKVLQVISIAAVVLLILFGAFWVYDNQTMPSPASAETEEMMEDMDITVEPAERAKVKTNVPSTTNKNSATKSNDQLTGKDAAKAKSIMKQRQIYNVIDEQNDSTVSRWNKRPEIVTIIKSKKT